MRRTSQYIYACTAPLLINHHPPYLPAVSHSSLYISNFYCAVGISTSWLLLHHLFRRVGPVVPGTLPGRTAPKPGLVAIVCLSLTERNDLVGLFNVTETCLDNVARRECDIQCWGNASSTCSSDRGTKCLSIIAHPLTRSRIDNLRCTQVLPPFHPNSQAQA